MDIPPIIVVSNKAENEIYGDVLADIWKIENPAQHDVEEPIFISAEHGDGLTDLHMAIR